MRYELHTSETIKESYTDEQQGNIISLLLFLQNKEDKQNRIFSEDHGYRLE
jgi:hypothetical protein